MLYIKILGMLLVVAASYGIGKTIGLISFCFVVLCLFRPGERPGAGTGRMADQLVHTDADHSGRIG